MHTMWKTLQERLGREEEEDGPHGLAFSRSPKDYRLRETWHASELVRGPPGKLFRDFQTFSDKYWLSAVAIPPNLIRSCQAK